MSASQHPLCCRTAIAQPVHVRLPASSLLSHCYCSACPCPPPSILSVATLLLLSLSMSASQHPLCCRTAIAQPVPVLLPPSSLLSHCYCSACPCPPPSILSVVTLLLLSMSLFSSQHPPCCDTAIAQPVPVLLPASSLFSHCYCTACPCPPPSILSVVALLLLSLSMSVSQHPLCCRTAIAQPVHVLLPASSLLSHCYCSACPCPPPSILSVVALLLLSLSLSSSHHPPCCHTAIAQPVHVLLPASSLLSHCYCSACPFSPPSILSVVTLLLLSLSQSSSQHPICCHTAIAQPVPVLLTASSLLSHCYCSACPCPPPSILSVVTLLLLSLSLSSSQHPLCCHNAIAQPVHVRLPASSLLSHCYCSACPCPPPSILSVVTLLLLSLSMSASQHPLCCRTAIAQPVPVLLPPSSLLSHCYCSACPCPPPSILSVVTLLLLSLSLFSSQHPLCYHTAIAQPFPVLLPASYLLSHCYCSACPCPPPSLLSVVILLLLSLSISTSQHALCCRTAIAQPVPVLLPASSLLSHCYCSACPCPPPSILSVVTLLLLSLSLFSSQHPLCCHSAIAQPVPVLLPASSLLSHCYCSACPCSPPSILPVVTLLLLSLSLSSSQHPLCFHTAIAQPVPVLPQPPLCCRTAIAQPVPVLLPASSLFSHCYCSACLCSPPSILSVVTLLLLSLSLSSSQHPLSSLLPLSYLLVKKLHSTLSSLVG